MLHFFQKQLVAKKKAVFQRDQIFYHSGDDIKSSVEQTQVVTLGQIDIEQPLVVISEIIPSAPTSRLPYFNYDPPLRSWDLTVEHHVFVI
jgi:hypothetical protein